jgi:hypothetical protein
MERDQRNALARAVVGARRLLEKELSEQLEGIYNILPDGKILDEAPGDPVTRARLLELIGHYRSGGASAIEARRRAVRESAFTVLNRFAALKLAERRGIVRECVSRGVDSDGMKELAGRAPGLLAASADGGYRLLLEAVMDEISLGLKVLFERRHPLGLLWPRSKALVGLLEILNASDLDQLWVSDEAIGWIYQYFNADDVREMREASSAPRDSRELAVRNQFFTPRYVVEFLTDNTLGRTWYEMRRGDTLLKDRCRYLVWRPSEVFLSEGEETPDGRDVGGKQGGKKPPRDHVRYRPKKDPRDLRVLDPAVGSGHFLLYSFDLLLCIYEEAWQDSGTPSAAVTGTRLRDDYPSLASLRRAAPELILRHNIYGIEIDPRCAQIASLALWLRAQRAWTEFGVDVPQRPAIQLTNIVVAEAMPGDKELAEEFATSLAPPALGDLFKAMVDEMRLAGELGYLLKIDESINLFLERARQEAAHAGLFDEAGRAGFWENAEERLIAALRSFAARAQGLVGETRRQLFAGDAVQGIALIDVVRRKYDVVLMNPPFGACSSGAKRAFVLAYPRTSNDLYAAFVERALQLLHSTGLVGAITSRTGFFLSSFQHWREEVLLRKARPTVVADLGLGVMDEAMVQAAAYCLEAVER